MTCPKEYLAFFNRVLESKPKKYFTSVPMPVECQKEVTELAEKKAFSVKETNKIPRMAVVWHDSKVVVLYGFKD